MILDTMTLSIRSMLPKSPPKYLKDRLIIESSHRNQNKTIGDFFHNIGIRRAYGVHDKTQTLNFIYQNFKKS